jgi:hypothetical protein
MKKSQYPKDLETALNEKQTIKEEEMQDKLSSAL